MLIEIGRDLLPGYSVLLYCTHCKQLQRPRSGACPWCTHDVDGVAACRVANTPQAQRVRELIKYKGRLPLQPSDLAMPEKDNVDARIQRGRDLGVCAPLVPSALYWDIPGSVGKADGFKYRHAYMNDREVFRLETGLNGRLFVQPEAFVEWAKNWHQTLHIQQASPSPDTWLEVPLRYLIKQQEINHAAVWTYDFLLMQDCLAFDVLEQLPGRLPLLGFEWGVTRVLPDSYQAACEMNLSLDGANPALRLTWSTTENKMTNGDWFSFHGRRKDLAERIRANYRS